MAPARLHKLKRQAHANTLAVARLESKLHAVEARLAARVPGICFGTGKLFRRQFHLELTAHADREAWEEAWRHAGAIGPRKKTWCERCARCHAGERRGELGAWSVAPSLR